ncbi:venom protein 164-like [Pomacea canaliculata]|uniref:venom protein 164-like n=1 Tax=Pomacea canaliculata TaxID=400727 RepID=UPI000D72A404|nr:venom protein 164-like [Pomacea canaliculata]
MNPILAVTCLIMLAVAMAAGEAVGTACSTSGDCPADYCCVSLARPIGKKRQVLVREGGTCQPLGQKAEGCLVRTGAYSDTQMYFSCPCVSGLKCRGNGMFDIPLGETGTCESS